VAEYASNQLRPFTLESAQGCEARQQRWLYENKDAISAWNEYVE
jgi:post-segregation antitoxin (ccd killing protein)